MWLLGMKWFQIFLAFALFVLGCLLVNDLSNLMRAITDWLHEKQLKTKKEAFDMTMVSSSTVMLFAQRLIEMEITHERNWHLAKGTACNFLMLDKEIDRISREIYGWLPPFIFDEGDDRVMLAPSFIEQFIVKEVTIQLATMYREVNITIAQTQGKK